MGPTKSTYYCGAPHMPSQAEALDRVVRITDEELRASGWMEQVRAAKVAPEPLPGSSAAQLHDRIPPVLESSMPKPLTRTESDARELPPRVAAALEAMFRAMDAQAAANLALHAACNDVWSAVRVERFGTTDERLNKALVNAAAHNQQLEEEIARLREERDRLAADNERLVGEAVEALDGMKETKELPAVSAPEPMRFTDMPPERLAPLAEALTAAAQVKAPPKLVGTGLKVPPVPDRKEREAGPREVKKQPALPPKAPPALEPARVGATFATHPALTMLGWSAENRAEKSYQKLDSAERGEFEAALRKWTKSPELLRRSFRRMSVDAPAVRRYGGPLWQVLATRRLRLLILQDPMAQGGFRVVDIVHRQDRTVFSHEKG